jgi:lipopolysaccharide export system permease protein
MPWTIYRYILAEVLKLLVITTAVMVMVISFAAAIKPLSDGLLGPMAMTKFVLYTAPTMLGFVLPFAGAFAATLVFLRMAVDNEIVACLAGGMSYRTILLPVFALGLVLMMGLFFLSNFVVPGFYRAAAQTLEDDLMTVMVSQLNENRPFRRGNVVLYADRATDLAPPHLPDQLVQPKRYIRLDHVAVGELNDEGTFKSDATAEEAHVLLFQHGDRSSITIRLFHPMRYDPISGDLGGAARWDTDTIHLPSYFTDKPKFLSWPQLRRLHADTQRNQRVQEYKRDLIRVICRRKLSLVLMDSLGAGPLNRTVHLDGPRPGEIYELSAAKVTSQKQRLILQADGDQPIVLRSQGVGRRFEASGTTLTILDSEDVAQPTVALRMEDVRVVDMRSGATAQRAIYTSPRLSWPWPLFAQPIAEISLSELIAESKRPVYADSYSITEAAARLVREQTRLLYRIIGHLNERAASAIACLLLLLLGSTLSMLLKKQLPLVVFFWSFLLAIVALIIINSGQNMAGNTEIPRPLSLGLLWSGDVLLLAVLAALYHRLARN